MRPAVAFLLGAALSPAAFAAKPPLDVGPEPASFAEFVRLAAPDLASHLIDPDSAKVTWDHGLVGGIWKPMRFSRAVAGWFTCGIVNSRNQYGGYAGARRFVSVFNNGAIVLTDVGDGGDLDFVTMGCNQLVASGKLPARAAAPPAVATLPPDAPRVGVSFTAVPDGVYVVSVEPASSAHDAGLVAGMVIARINGLEIKGFDAPTVQKMIMGADTVTLTIIGKGDVLLAKRQPKPLPQ